MDEKKMPTIKDLIKIHLDAKHPFGYEWVRIYGELMDSCQKNGLTDVSVATIKRKFSTPVESVGVLELGFIKALKDTLDFSIDDNEG